MKAHSKKNLALRNRLAALLLPVCLATTASAAQVHQHGLAEAAVVLEGNTLTVSFRAPLMDILGTEQAPADAATRSRYADRLAQITPPAPSASANCELRDATVSTVETLFPAARLEEEHGHDHGDAHTGHAHHADVDNEWTFLCQFPQKLQAVSLPFLETFSGLTTEVILLLPAGQGAQRLAPGETRIPLE